MHSFDLTSNHDPLPTGTGPTKLRSLKIEAHGDFWKGLIKPKIRLSGKWLERAGFAPGHRVEVKCIAPGIIELRCDDHAKVDGSLDGRFDLERPDLQRHIRA